MCLQSALKLMGRSSVRLKNRERGLILTDNRAVNESDADSGACGDNGVTSSTNTKPLKQCSNTCRKTLVRRDAVNMMRATLMENARPPAPLRTDAPVKLDDDNQNASHRLKTAIE